MGFNPAIRDKVRKLALDNKNNLTAKDIFLSDEFRSYLNSLLMTMKKNMGETNRIEIVEDSKDSWPGYTDGTTMHINISHKVRDYFDTLEGKFLSVMATFFHETAHDLFYDFNEEKNAKLYLKDGTFYGDIPNGMTAKEEANWIDMKEALDTPNTRQLFINVFGYIDNFIADRHDEDRLIDSYGSFVGEALYLHRQAKQSFNSYFETGERMVNRGEMDELSFMFSNTLQLCLFDEVLARSQSSVEQSDYWQCLEAIRSHVRIACATDDVFRKFTEINWILLYFWPYIRNAIQQMRDSSQQGQQSANSQKQSSNGTSGQTGQGQTGAGQASGNNQPGANAQPKTSSLSEEEVKKLLDMLGRVAQDSQGNPAPQGHHSSEIAINRRANERNGKAPEKNQAAAKAATSAMSKQGKEALSQAFNTISNQIAQNEAVASMEIEAKNDLVKTVTDVNASGPHSSIPLEISRVLDVSGSDIASYNEAMKELKPISKRLQKDMLNTLRDIKEGYTQKHKQFGRMIIPSDAYRPDQRMFANKKLPQDFPDMAVSVLVDHSGSMNGSRIKTAMKAALLLHDFCTGLNIPVAVAGHNAVMGGKVNYYIYADYEQISNLDKFRAARMAANLTKMTAHNCNRDGAALLISAKLLERRPEEVKLLFIISDGMPNHDDYSGEPAAKDIQNIVQQCKNKGIEVLACAIGDDREKIRGIYRDAFVDISNLQKLPQKLVNSVKKRIINAAL